MLQCTGSFLSQGRRIGSLRMTANDKSTENTKETAETSHTHYFTRARGINARALPTPQRIREMTTWVSGGGNVMSHLNFGGHIRGRTQRVCMCPAAVVAATVLVLWTNIKLPKYQMYIIVRTRHSGQTSSRCPRGTIHQCSFGFIEYRIYAYARALCFYLFIFCFFITENV